MSAREPSRPAEVPPQGIGEGSGHEAVASRPAVSAEQPDGGGSISTPDGDALPNQAGGTQAAAPPLRVVGETLAGKRGCLPGCLAYTLLALLLNCGLQFGGFFVDSKEDVERCAPGLWTHTDAGDLWYRLELQDGGALRTWTALPAAEGWGRASSGRWLTTSGKYIDTGGRWYGVNFRGGGLAVTGGVGTMEMCGAMSLTFGVGNGTEISLTKGDVHPFSR